MAVILTGGVPLFLSFGLGGTWGGEISISTVAGGAVWFSWTSVFTTAAIAFLYLSVIIMYDYNILIATYYMSLKYFEQKYLLYKTLIFYIIDKF